MGALVLSWDDAVGPACAHELGVPGGTVEVVSTADDVAAVAAGAEAPGGVDVLVAVAPMHPGAAVDQVVDEVTRSIAAVVPAMASAGSGRIVLVVPASGLPGSTWADGSGAASWGLVGLARSAARELAPSGVTVNVVRVGHLDPGDGAVDAAVVADTPLRRAATPADVAGAVAFLASADASYITGLVLPVDGGLAMGLGA